MNGFDVATPPSCVVRGRADIARVLAAKRPATLLSIPGAASSLGPLGWIALVGLAREADPGAAIADILDCADAPGRALEALRLGQRDLVLTTGGAVFRDVLSRARSLGAIVRPVRPPALDIALLGQKHRPEAAARHLARWLDGAANDDNPDPTAY